jgi:hypothetical protein
MKLCMFKIAHFLQATVVIVAALKARAVMVGRGAPWYPPGNRGQGFEVDPTAAYKTAAEKQECFWDAAYRPQLYQLTVSGRLSLRSTAFSVAPCNIYQLSTRQTPSTIAPSMFREVSCD